MLEKRKPLKPSLAAEVKGVESEIDNLPKRVSRYGKAKARAHEMQEFLKPLDLYQAEYLKLAGCANWLKFRNYYSVDKVRLHQASLCRKTLLCPLCAVLRGSKYLRAYLDRFNFIMSENEDLRASMITLTVKNGPDLTERYEHLKKSIQRLGKSRRNAKAKGTQSEWGKILGLVGSYEFTKKKNGWHPHVHVWALHRDPVYQVLLKKQWQKITGDSYIVDVTPAIHPDNPVEDFVEVFKYALKFSELSLADNLHAYGVLTGKRLIFSTGLFRGVKIPESMMDEPLKDTDLPFIEYMFRYVDKAGYSLDKSSLNEGTGSPPVRNLRSTAGSTQGSTQVSS